MRSYNPFVLFRRKKVNVQGLGQQSRGKKLRIKLCVRLGPVRYFDCQSKASVVSIFHLPSLHDRDRCPITGYTSRKIINLER
jgi:hypothetical protein